MFVHQPFASCQPASADGLPFLLAAFLFALLLVVVFLLVLRLARGRLGFLSARLRLWRRLGLRRWWRSYRRAWFGFPWGNGGRSSLRWWWRSHCGRRRPLRRWLRPRRWGSNVRRDGLRLGRTLRWRRRDGLSALFTPATLLDLPALIRRLRRWCRWSDLRRRSRNRRRALRWRRRRRVVRAVPPCQAARPFRVAPGVAAQLVPAERLAVAQSEPAPRVGVAWAVARQVVRAVPPCQLLARCRAAPAVAWRGRCAAAVGFAAAVARHRRRDLRWRTGFRRHIRCA